MLKKLSHIAAIQAKEQIQAEINRLIAEQHALLQNADQQIKKTHLQVSQTIATHIAQRIGVNEEMLTRLVDNVFGFNEVLVNLEPIKFQPYVHLKEMKKLRELLKVMESNGLIEIDHIFMSEDEKRFLVNSFLSDINRNIATDRFINPLTNTAMHQHEFYLHYFQIIHTTEKYMIWVEEALDQQSEAVNTVEPVASEYDSALYKAVA